MKLHVALEASSLLPPRTGIGRYTALLARQFARREDVELHLLINAWLPKYPRALAALRREFTGPRVHWHVLLSEQVAVRISDALTSRR